MTASCVTDVTHVSPHVHIIFFSSSIFSMHLEISKLKYQNQNGLQFLFQFSGRKHSWKSQTKEGGYLGFVWLGFVSFWGEDALFFLDKMHYSRFDNQSKNISLPLTEAGQARV